MFRDAPILDAEAYLIENPLTLRDFVDAPLRERIQPVVGDGGRLYWDIDDAAPAGGRARRRRDIGTATAGALFARTRLADMDRERIDVQIVFPALGLRVAGLVDAELEAALCRACNDALAAACAAAPTRLVPVGVVPMRDAGAAVDELRRCVVDLAMPAVAVPPVYTEPCAQAPDAFPELRRDVSLASTRFRPFFETADFLDVAVALHCGGGSDGADSTSGGLVHDVVGPRQAAQRALGDLIAAGHLERYARLRFGIFAAGCGWLPDFVHAFAERWQRRDTEPNSSVFATSAFAVETLRESGVKGSVARLRKLRALRAADAAAGGRVAWGATDVPDERNPEEYFARGQVFAAFRPGDPGPQRIRAAFGPVGERIALGSTGYGGVGEVARGAVDGVAGHPELSPEYVARLLSTNALRFFGERLRKRLAPGYPRSAALRPRAER